jgi:hypothetical protein
MPHYFSFRKWGFMHFVEISHQGITVQWRMGQRTIPWEDVQRIEVATIFAPGITLVLPRCLEHVLYDTMSNP